MGQERDLGWPREAIKRTWDSDPSVREAGEFCHRAVWPSERYFERTTLHAAGTQATGQGGMG